MQTHTLIETIREALVAERVGGKSVGLVPTMGNLHPGHLALVEMARRDNDLVVVSIFVNPLQFGPNEDFDAYPRTLEEDAAKLERAGTDVVFAPSLDAIYPESMEAMTTVAVPGLTRILCGAQRPGHFDGVTTVVNKLFNIISPDRAYFGEKDYQQLIVIRTMVSDLDMTIEVVGVPIVRDTDGLALSSRNAYLNANERTKAPGLYRTLSKIKAELESGALPGDAPSYEETTSAASAELERLGFLPDYVEVRKRADLEIPDATCRELIALGAASLGRTRLIDNVTIDL